jgi:hypothetical protein
MQILMLFGKHTEIITSVVGKVHIHMSCEEITMFERCLEFLGKDAALSLKAPWPPHEDSCCRPKRNK